VGVYKAIPTSDCEETRLLSQLLSPLAFDGVIQPRHFCLHSRKVLLPGVKVLSGNEEVAHFLEQRNMGRISPLTGDDQKVARGRAHHPKSGI